MDQYYCKGDVGPLRIKFAVHWPLSVKGAKVELLEKVAMCTHGIWPSSRVLTPAQMEQILEASPPTEIDEACLLCIFSTLCLRIEFLTIN